MSDASSGSAPPIRTYPSLTVMVRTLVLEPKVVRRPPQEDWAAMICRISTPDQVNEIDEETDDYFLDVLPPKYQGRGIFAFAEGAEPLKLFVTHGGRHLCRQLTWDETREFCRLAGIGLPC